MASKEYECINFSENHELEYVVSLYLKEERSRVRLLLKLLGATKGRDNLTHEEVYLYLRSHGCCKEIECILEAYPSQYHEEISELYYHIKETIKGITYDEICKEIGEYFAIKYGL